MNEEINKTYNSLPEEEKEQLNLFEKKGITEIKQISKLEKFYLLKLTIIPKQKEKKELSM